MLNENIKKIRNNRGMTQKELADQVGISGAFMSLIEKGTNKPSEENLSKIAKALRVEIRDLLKEEPKTPLIKLLNLLIELTEKGKIKWNVFEYDNNNEPLSYNTYIKNINYNLYFNNNKDLKRQKQFKNHLEIGETKDIEPSNKEEIFLFEKLYNSIISYEKNGDQIFESINDLESLLND